MSNDSFYSTGVYDPRHNGPFSLFIQRYINMEEKSVYVDPPPLVSLIEIPASPAPDQPLPGGAPLGPCGGSWRRERPFGTVPTQTGISQGMGV